MKKLEPQELLNRLQQTLAFNHIDYEKIILTFGQVEASEKRVCGVSFTLQEHFKGLILSMLSNQRPWGPIADNLDKIQNIFTNYDTEKVIDTKPEYLVLKLKEIKCGNRAITKQMQSLKYNLKILNQIQSKYGSLDNFVTSKSPDIIAKKLGRAGKYKLRQIGFTLAMEYLRNLGIKAIKPDVHVRRALSKKRLGFFEGVPSEEEAFVLFDNMAKRINCNPTYLDNLLWIFCAINYGNICGARPKCHLCGLADRCNYSA